VLAEAVNYNERGTRSGGAWSFTSYVATVWTQERVSDEVGSTTDSALFSQLVSTTGTGNSGTQTTTGLWGLLVDTAGTRVHAAGGGVGVTRRGQR